MHIRGAPEGVRLPDPAMGRLIERYGSRIADPIERLRFLRACGGESFENRPPALQRGPLRPWADHMAVLDCLARVGSMGRARVSWEEQSRLWVFRGWRKLYAWNQAFRYGRAVAVAAGLLAVIAVGVATGPGGPGFAPPVESASVSVAPNAESANLEIWLVESNEDEELYSNGLQISNEPLTEGEPRRYAVFERRGDEVVEQEPGSEPVGIVYHTTFSELSPPLQRENNELIRDKGRNLLSYLARERLYNFVIDRFGRVYRVVAEEQAAFHAGHSLWESDNRVYLNLNESFIGIGFETRPEALDPEIGAENGVTDAQFASARRLTGMLREKFSISEQNCVTHEMVSLNPSNMLIGYHTDWIGRFPFARLGLPDHYLQSLPSVARWGFEYDSQFVAAVGGRVWPGVGQAQLEFRRAATALGITAAEHRRRRAKQYRRLLDRARKVRVDGAGASGI